MPLRHIYGIICEGSFFVEDLCKDIQIIHCYLYFHLFFIVVIKILLNNIYGY
jgi:hypothetical protein